MRKWFVFFTILLVVMCLFLTIAPSAATIIQGAAMPTAAPYELKPNDGDSSVITMTAGTLRAILDSQALHDERMAQEIVKVAMSGDASQTSSSAIMGGLFTIIIAAIVIGFIVLLVSKTQEIY